MKSQLNDHKSIFMRIPKQLQLLTFLTFTRSLFWGRFLDEFLSNLFGFRQPSYCHKSRIILESWRVCLMSNQDLLRYHFTFDILIHEFSIIFLESMLFERWVFLQCHRLEIWHSVKQANFHSLTDSLLTSVWNEFLCL